MAIHLQRDLERLKKQILSVGALVEEAASNAMEALVYRRVELAEAVLTGDGEIDKREVELEENCLKVLALHQPVAADLRFIIAALKVNNDLERMGDLAVNIAERAAYLATHDALTIALDFPAMAEATRTMVRECLDAFVRQDTALARKVIADDETVDDYNRAMFAQVQAAMITDPPSVKRAMHMLSASRHLERIADLATNIAEDVLFMVDGEVVRHRPERYV